MLLLRGVNYFGANDLIPQSDRDTAGAALAYPVIFALPALPVAPTPPDSKISAHLDGKSLVHGYPPQTESPTGDSSTHLSEQLVTTQYF